MESSRCEHRKALDVTACAQRLAASMESSHCMRSTASRAVSWCSTPCGINGILTDAMRVAYEPSCMCSTPCGINGILTCVVRMRRAVIVHVLNALRHQWNPHTAGHERFDAGLVLNALRHQWNPHQCSTPCGINGILTSTVLNALRHQWNPHTASGAQRLAASMESSRQVQTRQVLNALRHQWNPHQWGATLRHVLNALRHQWNPHTAQTCCMTGA